MGRVPRLRVRLTQPDRRRLKAIRNRARKALSELGAWSALEDLKRGSRSRGSLPRALDRWFWAAHGRHEATSTDAGRVAFDPEVGLAELRVVEAIRAGEEYDAVWLRYRDDALPPEFQIALGEPLPPGRGPRETSKPYAASVADLDLRHRAMEGTGIFDRTDVEVARRLRWELRLTRAASGAQTRVPSDRAKKTVERVRRLVDILVTTRPDLDPLGHSDPAVALRSRLDRERGFADEEKSAAVDICLRDLDLNRGSSRSLKRRKLSRTAAHVPGASRVGRAARTTCPKN